MTAGAREGEAWNFFVEIVIMIACTHIYVCLLYGRNHAKDLNSLKPYNNPIGWTLVFLPFGDEETKAHRVKVFAPGHIVSWVRVPRKQALSQRYAVRRCFGDRPCAPGNNTYQEVKETGLGRGRS